MFDGVTAQKKPLAEKASQLIKDRRERFGGVTYAFISREMEKRGLPIPVLGLKRIERGERKLDVDELVALFQVLDIPLSELLPTDGVAE